MRFLLMFLMFPTFAHANKSSCAFLLDHIETNFIGAKVATFKADEYKPEYEKLLRDEKVDLIIINEPSANDRQTLEKVSGYFRKPAQVAWKMATQPMDKYIEALSSKERSRFRVKLGKSEGKVKVEIAPLTLEDFRTWYEIYDVEVAGKDRGRRVIDENWAKEKGKKLKKYYRMFFRDLSTGELIGGALLRPSKNSPSLQAPYAAYKRAYRDIEMPIRAFTEVLSYAHTNGFKELNWGVDTNLYGHHLSVGLMEFKSSLRFQPEASGEDQILKVLNPAILNSDYFFFGFSGDKLKGYHFTSKPRSLTAPAGVDVETYSQP